MRILDSNNTFSSETFSDLSHDAQCPHKICSGSGIESKLPHAFIKRMRTDFETTAEYERFIACYSDAPVRAMRINTLKISKERFLDLCPWRTKQSELLNEGLILTENPEHIGTHPYHIAGLFYMQEPSAMSVVEAAEIAPGIRVLDLCAAPGGKSGGIAARLCGRGILVSNEIIPNRAKTLARNLERLGIVNAVVTSAHPDAVAEALPQYFDRVVVDAPCSGEGMFRKDEAVIGTWTPERPDFFADLQREITSNAVKMLRPGGLMMYSTCTFAPQEDEGTVSFLLENFPEMELIEMEGYEGFSKGNPVWGNGDPEIEKTVRIWPHKMNGEGHYLALFRKKGEAIPYETEEKPIEKKNKKQKNRKKDRGTEAPGPSKAEKQILSDFLSRMTAPIPVEELEVRAGKVYHSPSLPDGVRNLHFLRNGLYLGELKKDRFEPSQPFAVTLSADKFKDYMNLKADDERTEKYLHGETISVEPGETASPSGWKLVCVDGFGLGWGKLVKGTLKNKYPVGWRK